MPRPPLVLGAGLLSAALLLPYAADAQLYQWVDERGVEVLAPYSVRQGEFETMDAHRRAALIRLTDKL